MTDAICAAYGWGLSAVKNKVCSWEKLCLILGHLHFCYRLCNVGTHRQAVIVLSRLFKRENWDTVAQKWRKYITIFSRKGLIFIWAELLNVFLLCYFWGGKAYARRAGRKGGKMTLQRPISVWVENGLIYSFCQRRTDGRISEEMHIDKGKNIRKQWAKELGLITSTNTADGLEVMRTVLLKNIREALNIKTLAQL